MMAAFTEGENLSRQARGAEAFDLMPAKSYLQVLERENSLQKMLHTRKLKLSFTPDGLRQSPNQNNHGNLYRMK